MRPLRNAAEPTPSGLRVTFRTHAGDVTIPLRETETGTHVTATATVRTVRNLTGKTMAELVSPTGHTGLISIPAALGAELAPGQRVEVRGTVNNPGLPTPPVVKVTELRQVN